MAEEGNETVLEQAASRDSVIVRTSIVGIIGNVVLAAFKVAVGLVSNSIAIVLDAVNNLSDALSSLITIIGTKLSLRPADHDHPYGYGRVEYLSAIIIAAIVLAAGISSLKESVEAILDPATPVYTAPSLIIIAATVVVKLVLGRYVKGVGEKVNSGSLVASGTDATNDAIISTTTLVAAGIFLATGFKLEGILGAAISVFIIKSGVEMLQETLSKVLGERVETEVSQAVKEAAASVDGVLGVYDLILHDYGPDRMSGTLHVEVDEAMTAPQIDLLAHRVQMAVMRQCGVVITSVGIYATNSEAGAAELREQISEIVSNYEHVVQMHGFYVDEPAKAVHFDVVISFDDHDRRGTAAKIQQECAERFPEYTFMVVPDVDISD